MAHNPLYGKSHDLFFAIKYVAGTIKVVFIQMQFIMSLTKVDFSVIINVRKQ